ncbi:hypothetical protein HDU97_009034 [Phlyctochytrium planicorne]|nr:hypothetical protein HDU97_009034 [Phlyctochytrium planicorne]
MGAVARAVDLIKRDTSAYCDNNDIGRRCYRCVRYCRNAQPIFDVPCLAEDGLATSNVCDYHCRCAYDTPPSDELYVWHDEWHLLAQHSKYESDVYYNAAGFGKCARAADYVQAAMRHIKTKDDTTARYDMPVCNGGYQTYLHYWVPDPSRYRSLTDTDWTNLGQKLTWASLSYQQWCGHFWDVGAKVSNLLISISTPSSTQFYCDNNAEFSRESEKVDTRVYRWDGEDWVYSGDVKAGDYFGAPAQLQRGSPHLERKPKARDLTSMAAPEEATITSPDSMTSPSTSIPTFPTEPTRDILIHCLGTPTETSFTLTLPSSAPVSKLRSSISSALQTPSHHLILFTSTHPSFAENILTDGRGRTVKGLIVVGADVIEKAGGKVLRGVGEAVGGTIGEETIEVALDARFYEAEQHHDAAGGSGTLPPPMYDATPTDANKAGMWGSVGGDASASGMAGAGGSLFGTSTADIKPVIAHMNSLPGASLATSSAAVGDELRQDGGFLTATAAGDDEAVRKAKENDKEDYGKAKRNRRWIFLAAVLGVVLIGAAAVVGTIVGLKKLHQDQGNSSNNDQDRSIPSPTSTSEASASLITEFKNGFESDSVRFHPSLQSFYATSRQTGQIYQYNIATRSPIRTLDGHTASVSFLILAYDTNKGLSLFTFGFDDAIMSWDLTTGERIRTFNASGWSFPGGSVSPDGSYLWYPMANRTIARVSLAAGTPEFLPLGGRIKPWCVKALSSTEVFVGGSRGYFGLWTLNGNAFSETIRYNLTDGQNTVSIPPERDGDIPEEREPHDPKHIEIRAGQVYVASFFEVNVFSIARSTASGTAPSGARIGPVSLATFVAPSITDIDINDDGSRVVTTDLQGKVGIWRGVQSPNTFWLFNANFEMHGVSIANGSAVVVGSGPSFYLVKL